MSIRSLVSVVIGIAIIIGGTAVFLSASKNRAFQAAGTLERSTVVKINGVTIPVELANSPVEQAQGLSERLSLPPGSGMLFVFEQERPASFWMRKMNFDLDIVWVRDGKIAGIERNVPAPVPGTAEDDLPKYDSPGMVSHVLEINAGEAASWTVGDVVTISSVQAI